MKLKNIIVFVAIFVLAFLFIDINITVASEYRAPEVKVFNTDNKHQDMAFMAYDRLFKGGGNVAVCDTNGDNIDEIVVGAGPGGGPHVRIFDYLGNFTGYSLFPFHPDYRGGVDVACGDVNGDKKDELVVSQFSDGQAWIKIYKADISKTILAEFIAYDEKFEGGAHVAACDINGDGKAEVITGSGMHSTAHVRGFNKKGEYMGLSLFPFEEGHRGGVDVACGNVDGGREYEVVVGKNTFGSGQVKVYKSDLTKRILGDFLAFPEPYREGVNITAGDIDRDGMDEIIVGSNGHSSHIRTFESHGEVKALDIRPYEDEFKGGVKVAIGNVDESSASEIIAMPGRRAWEGRDLYKYIEVNLSEQKLEAYRGGRKVNEFLISSGIGQYPTPVGDFSIWLRLTEDRMTGNYGENHPDNYDIPDVPYVMYFNGPYALHGAYWHNNFGHPMSHGCINISVHDAAWLHNWTTLGDKVFVRP